MEFTSNRQSALSQKNEKTRKFGLGPQVQDVFKRLIETQNNRNLDNEKILVLAAADKVKSQIDNAQKESVTDSLTGLYNRRFLDSYIENFDKSADKKNLIIAFCDIDSLGMVNKLKGDIYGDQLIKKTASLIKSQLKEEDLLVRKGGDEFIVITSSSSGSDEKMKELSTSLESVQTTDVKFSFGVVRFDSSQDLSLRDTIQRGDCQMKINNPLKKKIKNSY